MLFAADVFVIMKHIVGGKSISLTMLVFLLYSCVHMIEIVKFGNNVVGGSKLNTKAEIE